MNCSDYTVEDLEEYKKNASKILRKSDQHTTAKLVEDLFDEKIALIKIADAWNNVNPNVLESINLYKNTILKEGKLWKESTMQMI